MGVVECHPPGRQFVDVRRVANLVPVNAERFGRLIISQNEKKVGSFLCGTEFAVAADNG